MAGVFIMPPATGGCLRLRLACVAMGQRHPVRCQNRSPATIPTGAQACVRRDLFGRCLREPGMVELVAAEVGGSSTAASALAFTAAIGRDHGVVPQSLRLFRRVPASLWFVPLGFGLKLRLELGFSLGLRCRDRDDLAVHVGAGSPWGLWPARWCMP